MWSTTWNCSGMSLKYLVEQIKIPILENYLSLKKEVWRRLAGFKIKEPIFIILSIWREANRLVQFQWRPPDRITEILVITGVSPTLRK